MKTQDSKVYVQFGCGLSTPDGWVNFDASPRLKFERLPLMYTLTGALNKRLFPKNVKFGDIIAGLPLPDNSAEAIYSSHVLEHLSRNKLEPALANIFKCLRSGGTFRMIVPDIHWRVQNYIKAFEASDPNAADNFINECNMGEPVAPQGLMGRMRAAYGNSGHQWMYDYNAMHDALQAAGFINIRRCKMGDNPDPMFAKVEDEGRFFDSGFTELALEAKKP